MKKEIKEIRRLRLRTRVLLFYLIVFVILGVVLSINYRNLSEDYQDLANDYDKCIDNYEKLVKDYDELQANSERVRLELEGELEQYKIKKEPLTKQTTKVSNDVIKYTKYYYTLKDTEGSKNDMTKDLIKYGYELMKSKNMDPSLLFGIIMVESEGHKDCYMTSTQAAGLGQFLPDTGKYVYENLMGNEGYNHSSTPYDPKTNICMIVTYLDYLYDFHNGDTMKVLKQYCGGDDTFTYNYYLKVTNWVGYCIN